MSARTYTRSCYSVLCNRALAFSVQSLPNSLARLKITLATFRLPILILFLARGNY